MPESLCLACITLIARVNLSRIILHSADRKKAKTIFLISLFGTQVRTVMLESFYEIPRMPHL